MTGERCPACLGPVRDQSGAPGWCDRCQPLTDERRAAIAEEDRLVAKYVDQEFEAAFETASDGGEL